MISSTLFSIFKHGSKTYFYCSLFFPDDIKEDVFRLYGFVRTVDDLVDCIPQKKEEFYQFTKLFHEVMKGKKVDNEIINGFIETTQKYSFEKSWIKAFLDAMEQDLIKKEYKTIHDVEKYMFGSAEVIGLMMASILQLPQKSWKGARLLGKSMQYANFIRDIQEDNTFLRTYFPKTSLKKHKLESLQQGEVIKKSKNFELFIGDQIQLYENWYTDAKQYFKYIPYRYRIPIQSAAELYYWSMLQIKKNPTIVFKRKVKPSILRILYTLCKSAVYSN